MNTKAKLIKKHGSDVVLKRLVSGTFTETPTKAMIGRGNRSNTALRQLESQKEGIFYPDLDIDSGDYVHDPILNEDYVVSALYPEPFKNKVIAKIGILHKCNSFLSVKGQKKVADTRGNLKVQFVDVCADIPCYMEEVTNELRQYQAGLHPDTEYMVYSPAVDAAETDQILLKIRGVDEQFKAVAKDFVTIPNLLILQVARDVRK